MEEINWSYESKADSKIYDTCLDQVKHQIALEKMQHLHHVIHHLGFKEEKDYQGNLVLKNRIPIKNHIDSKEEKQLISRLTQVKSRKVQRSQNYNKWIIVIVIVKDLNS